MSNKEMSVPKILKAEHVELYFDSSKYEHNIKLHCQHLLRQAQHEVAYIKQKAYEDGVNKLHEESIALNSQLFEKYQKLADQLEDNISDVINKILSKFGIDNDLSKHLKSIISTELQNNKNENIIVAANCNMLKSLKLKLEGINNITFELDEKLLDGECIYETNLHLILITCKLVS